MASIKRLTFKGFEDIKDSVKDLKEFIKIEAHNLEIDVMNTLDDAMQEFEGLVLKNLTDYNASNAKERHAIIREAFENARAVFGFNFNEKGSFLDTSAKKYMEEDLSVSGGQERKEVSVSGRLEEMEKGRANWRAMKGFFYANRPQFEKHLGKDASDSFYRRLATLFKYKRDPTMPLGRRYIGHAAKKTHENIDEGIKKKIEEAFPGGAWNKQ